MSAGSGNSVKVSAYDPIRAFKFVVTLNGVGEIGFQKASGLKEASDVVEYREGNVAIHKRKLPGLTNYDPITLTKGAGPKKVAQALFDWRKKVARYGYPSNFYDGNVSGNESSSFANSSATEGFRHTVSIDVFDKGMDDTSVGAARTWNVHMAWPSEFSVSDLSAEASEILIETLVLQHEGLEPVTFQS